MEKKTGMLDEKDKYRPVTVVRKFVVVLESYTRKPSCPLSDANCEKRSLTHCCEGASICQTQFMLFKYGPAPSVMVLPLVVMMDWKPLQNCCAEHGLEKMHCDKTIHAVVTMNFKPRKTLR